MPCPPPQHRLPEDRPRNPRSGETRALTRIDASEGVSLGGVNQRRMPGRPVADSTGSQPLHFSSRSKGHNWSRLNSC